MERNEKQNKRWMAGRPGRQTETDAAASDGLNMEPASGGTDIYDIRVISGSLFILEVLTTQLRHFCPTLRCGRHLYLPASAIAAPMRRRTKGIRLRLPPLPLFLPLNLPQWA